MDEEDIPACLDTGYVVIGYLYGRQVALFENGALRAVPSAIITRVDECLKINVSYVVT